MVVSAEGILTYLSILSSVEVNIATCIAVVKLIITLSSIQIAEMAVSVKDLRSRGRYN